jgi:hypothetical protein
VIVRGVQVGTLVLVMLLGLGAVVSAVIAYEIRGVSNDVGQAESHLPRTVGNTLPSSGGMLDSNQVTLVSYSSGIAKGTAVLFATAPDHRFSSIMSVSPGVRIGTARHVTLRKRFLHPRRLHPRHHHHQYRVTVGTPLLNMTTTQTITAFRNAGIPVTHVALIDATNLEPLVEAVGGITVVNRTPFAASPANGQPVRFPRGTLHLDGAHAAAFVQASTSRESLGPAENAALVGIVHAILAPTGVSQLEATGKALAQATATDLTTADVLGLVEMRVRGGQLVQCRLTGPGNLADPKLQAIVNQALGRTVTKGPACQTRTLSAAAVVPPAVLVEAVQHYGWQLFVGIAILLAGLAVSLGWLLRARWWNPGRARYY